MSIESNPRDTVVLDRDKEKEKLKPPPMWNVVFYNDDFTPYDFVVMLLVELFKHDMQTALTITSAVDKQGKGIAGTFAHDIAETKTAQAISAARKEGHPLKVVAEKVDS